jgi:hypothetical protein
MVTCATLREPTPQDVTRALAAAPFGGWPQDDDDLLGFFRLMLEALLVDGCKTSPSQVSRRPQAL